MRRVTASLVSTVVLAGTVFAAIGTSRTLASSRNAYKIEEQPLGPIHDHVLSVVFSKDGCHLAYVIRKGAKFAVVVDAQPGPEYDWIGRGPIFSPDGKRVAYAAMKGDKWVVVVDGRPGPEYDEIRARTLLFSPDGKRVAYAARKGSRKLGKWHVVVDPPSSPGDSGEAGGQAGPEYHAIVTGPIFSPDAKRVVYVAAEFSPTKGTKFLVVVAGKPQPDYGRIDPESFIFSPNGKRPAGDVPGGRLAYVARKGGKCRVVVDGQPGPDYDSIRRGPIFSRNGNRVAYAAKKGDKQFVVLEGKPGPEYDGITGLIFSPEGKRPAGDVPGGRVAYVARKSNKYFVVVDGEPGPEYDSILRGTPIFSPDGKHVAYAGKKGGKWLLVVDGKPQPEHGAITMRSIIFSPDGKRVAYVVEKADKQLVVVDGQAGPEYDWIEPGTLAFSPDGNRVGYAARKGSRKRGKWFVVVDGQPGPEYDWVGSTGPVFSPDGKHVAYVAQKADKQLLVLDGWAGPEYDRIPWGSQGGLAFHGDGRLEYLADKNGTLLRVKHVPVLGWAVIGFYTAVGVGAVVAIGVVALLITRSRRRKKAATEGQDLHRG